MVDGVGVPCAGDLAGGVGLGREVVVREEVDGLRVVGQLQGGPFLETVVGREQAVHDFGQGRDAHASLCVDEVPVVVVVQALFEEGVMLFRPEDAGLDAVFLFVAEKVGAVQQFVEGLDHLDVHVHVDAAVVVDGIQADVVGREGIFTGFEGLPHPFGGMEVETVPVPQDELIVGEFGFPRGHIVLQVLGNGVAAQPAVMYDFGYHLAEGLAGWPTFCSR